MPAVSIVTGGSSALEPAADADAELFVPPGPVTVTIGRNVAAGVTSAASVCPASRLTVNESVSVVVLIVAVVDAEYASDPRGPEAVNATGKVAVETSTV